MFGPIGYSEMVFIFVLALLLFGPKKLPELGKMMGKALTEFNRAKNELKANFDREMRDLERETQSIAESTSIHTNDSYTYDYSAYDGHYDSELPPHDPSTPSASATQGAESTQAITEPVAAPEGAIAQGSLAHEATSHIPAHGETAEHVV